MDGTDVFVSLRAMDTSREFTQSGTADAQL